MDTHLAFKILVPGTYNIHNSDLMGEWVANDIHLQTTALQLWPQRWPQKAFDQLGRVAGHWVFRLSHFRWLRVWVNDFFPTAELVQRHRNPYVRPLPKMPQKIMQLFVQTPPQRHSGALNFFAWIFRIYLVSGHGQSNWNWAISWNSAQPWGVVSKSMTMDAMETHFSLIFRPTHLPENWPHCHHWYLSAKIPKAKEIQEESSAKKKATLQLKEKETFKNQANCDFRNEKTLLSQCVQYAALWLPGFSSFREPPSSPSGIVCWYTSNVTNWLAWKKQDICTEMLLILFKPRSNKLWL